MYGSKENLALRLRPALVCLLAVVVATAGCMVGPDYCPNQPTLPDFWHQELDNVAYLGDWREINGTQPLSENPELETGGCFVEGSPNQWWTTLNDPTLVRLIQQARYANRDLYAAYSRIQQARAQRNIANSPRIPFIDYVDSFENFKISPNSPAGGSGSSFDRWIKGFDTSWEIDVFGRIARQVESAEANQQATIESYRDILICLDAEVARSYIQLRTFQAQLRFAEENVQNQQQSLDYASNRFKAELVPELDVHQANLNLHRTAAAVPSLQSGIQRELYLLATLIGQVPGTAHDLLEPTAPIPQPPQQIDLVLPNNLLRQRPDIRQAERLVAAQVAQVGVATSDLYPRFNLFGTFILDSKYLSNLFESDSFAYSVSPGFRWAIFHGGQIRNNIALQSAAGEETVARYEQTVLDALREVETSIAAYRYEQVRQDDLESAVDAAVKALKNVSEQYRTGQTDFQNVLVTEQSLAELQNLYAVSTGQVALNLISLYKALGGGWSQQDHCRPPLRRLACIEPLAAESVQVEEIDPPPADSDDPLPVVVAPLPEASWTEAAQPLTIEHSTSPIDWSDSDSDSDQVSSDQMSSDQVSSNQVSSNQVSSDSNQVSSDSDQVSSDSDQVSSDSDQVSQEI